MRQLIGINARGATISWRSFRKIIDNQVNACVVCVGKVKTQIFDGEGCSLWGMDFLSPSVAVSRIRKEKEENVLPAKKEPAVKSRIVEPKTS